MEPDEYKPKASAKVRTRYHIVLVTKYRKHALAGIDADVLVSIPPDMTISGTVSRIKQFTTRELWGKHPNHLKRYYWEAPQAMVIWTLLRNRGKEQRKHSRALHRQQRQAGAIHPRH